MNLWEERRRWKEWQYQLWSFQKWILLLWQNLKWQKNWPDMGKCTFKMGTYRRKEGGGRNGSINCGVSKNEFFYYGKTWNGKKIELKWESALVKWELVGGKKELEGMAASIVEFPKMNSSIMAKIEMAKNFIWNGKLHL